MVFVVILLTIVLRIVIFGINFKSIYYLPTTFQKYDLFDNQRIKSNDHNFKQCLLDIDEGRYNENDQNYNNE